MKFLQKHGALISELVIYLTFGLIVAGSYYVTHRVTLETEQFYKSGHPGLNS